MTKLGDFIKRKRDEKGLSNSQLASAAGISESTIDQILAGDITRPPDERLRGLARVLDVSFDHLLSLIPESDRERGANLEMGNVTLALNMDEGHGAPERLELIPPGPMIRGRDGREWNMSDPQGVIEATRARGVHIPIDINHAIDLRAPEGKTSPAVAWIDPQNLTVSDSGAIVAPVAWNATGQATVANREYRYLSPVFLFNPESRGIHSLVSVALVNRPNLELPALNSQQRQKETQMDPKLLAALNLSQGATVDEVVAAINALKTARSDAESQLAQAKNTPDPTAWVPMSQYNAVLTRATNAETTINQQAQATQQAAINAAVDKAIKEGKLTPSAKDYYVAACQQDGGLDRFNAFIATAPKVMSDQTTLGKETPAQDDTASNSETITTLTAQQKALCAEMGLKEEDYLKSLNRLASDKQMRAAQA